MDMILNAREVFEIAEQIERNGGRFYRRAAEMAPDDKAKQFLLRLADMEDDHETLFRALKEEFTGEDGDKLVDIDDQALSYLRAIAGGAVFDVKKDMSEIITGQESLEEIYKIAMEFEKNTIVYFSAVKNMIPEDLGKSKIDSLIMEEIKHLATLVEELNLLNS